MLQIPSMSCEQVRQVDELAISKYGFSGLVLMENAGKGAADILHTEYASGNIVILCGRGNNGGDGFVIARHLQIHGRDVSIISISPIESLSGDAAANARIAMNAEIPILIAEETDAWKASLRNANLIVDCLLGTGASGAPRGIFAETVRAANQSEAKKIAIDLPTGLDADSGQAHDPTFKADRTITFVAEKTGFAESGAQKYLGIVHTVSIGIPKKLIHEIYAAHR